MAKKKRQPVIKKDDLGDDPLQPGYYIWNGTSRRIHDNGKPKFIVVNGVKEVVPRKDVIDTIEIGDAFVPTPEELIAYKDLLFHDDERPTRPGQAPRKPEPEVEPEGEETETSEPIGTGRVSG